MLLAIYFHISFLGSYVTYTFVPWVCLPFISGVWYLEIQTVLCVEIAPKV